MTIEIENQVVSIRSDKKQNIILQWPDLKIYLSIENAKLLVDGLEKAILYEENLCQAGQKKIP